MDPVEETAAGDERAVEQVNRLWPTVLVPEPRPWPRSFGWVARADETSALLVWFPGEPGDSELPMLRELTPRIEVELVRPGVAEPAAGELDVLVGELRLPGVLGRAKHGWTATLLVPGDQVDDGGDLAVTVRAAGVPAPLQLRLEVQPVAELLQGRRRMLSRMQLLS